MKFYFRIVVWLAMCVGVVGGWLLAVILAMVLLLPVHLLGFQPLSNEQGCMACFLFLFPGSVIGAIWARRRTTAFLSTKI